MQTDRWTYRLILLLLIGLGTAACASYPSDPRNPETEEDTYPVEEDGFLSVAAEQGILANDHPKEGTENILMTVGELETDRGGQVVLAEDGSFTYEPAENFNGTDQLTYTIRNEKNKSSDGVVSFNVTPVNDPPTPVDDRLEIPSNQTATIDVLANDLEPDGDAMRVLEVGEPASGSVVIAQNNSLVYIPATNHSGDVSFSYTVTDGQGEQGEQGEQGVAWVFLTITDANNGINLQPDTITVAEDSATTLPLSQLLQNDSGIGLTIIALGGAQRGTVVRSGENFTYTPNPDFSGTDTFTYTVQAQNGSTASTTVTVMVAGQSDPPTISQIVDQTTRAGSMTAPIAFTVEDLDTPLEELTITAAVSNAAPPNLVTNNNITISGRSENRSLRIQPTGTLAGTATITVTVSDGQAQSSESFVLSVTSPTAPTISFIADHTTALNTPLTVNFSIGDQDTFPINLIVTAVSSNQAIVPNANLVIIGDRSNRSIRITPAAGQLGTTVITISVSDGTQVTRRSFALQVYSPDDGDPGGGGAPTISRIDDQSTPQDTSLSVDFTLGDPDTYPVNLTVTAVSNNQVLVPNANLAISGDRSDRSIRITPAAGQLGSAIITINASDGTNLTQRSFALEVYAALQSNPGANDPGGQMLAIASSVSRSVAAKGLNSSLDDQFTTPEDTALTCSAAQGVLVNDTANLSGALAVSSTAFQSSRHGGEVQVAATGAFIYTPPANYTGKDYFQYTVSPMGDTRTRYLANVVVMVTAIDDPPLAENDHYSLAAGDILRVAAAQGALANDAEVEDQPLQVSALNHARLNLKQNGSFTYTPAAGFSGRENFTYTVSDGRRSAKATLTFFVGENHAPVVRRDRYGVSARQVLRLAAGKGLLANDTDPDATPLSIAATGVFDTLFGGEVNIGPAGQFTYFPPPEFAGVDRFTYTVTDGQTSAIGRADISVAPE